MKKIIIVGGGIAGLAAGIYGLKAGMAADRNQTRHAAVRNLAGTWGNPRRGSIC